MKHLVLSMITLIGLYGCSGEVQIESSAASSSGGGSGGSGGQAGGGGVLEGADRPSCAGKDLICGDHGCCTSTAIPGGSYNRLNDPAYPATVSGFWLDMFEVTAGRMRSFVEAYPGSAPAVGAGAHPKVPESGWAEGTYLPASPEALRKSLGAVNLPSGSKPQYAAWTDEAGPNENRPVTFVTWEVAQAFCIWDGGRLPTEAEWNYAASGGDEQRKYPWGSQSPTPALAVLNFNEPGGPYDGALFDVGSVPAGAGRWGQLDLSGGRSEMMFDTNLGDCCEAPSELPVPCDDCVVLAKDGEEGRMVRDQSAFQLAGAEVSNEDRTGYFEMTQIEVRIGFRCVYVPDAG